MSKQPNGIFDIQIYLGQGRIANHLSQGPLLAYSVEKLEKYEGLFFFRKSKHSNLLTALNVQAHQ